MTIASRLALYLEGIDTTSFSPTVLDSIRVTLSIGLRYLWVDAFCIVQDSSHKNLELVKMSSIYSGAVCTICVMSAQAATKGFLKPAQSVENNTIATWNVNVCDAISNQAVALEIRSDLSGLIHQSEPLLNRAWTFQEALLSPRLIMFSEGQRPTFRCSRSSLRSDGGIVSQIPRSLNYLGNVIARHQNELDPLSYKILDDWASIVKEYTGRSVTNEEDRFPALMGIVAEWENRMSLGTYCAGLWSKQIRYHLLWRPWRSISPRATHKSYIAPSWSWASRAHPVYYQPMGELCDDNDCTRVLACDITPVDPRVPNGAIKSARLTIECAAELVKLPEFRENTTSSEVKLQTSRGNVYFIFDDNPRPHTLKKIWLLTLGSEEPYNNPHEVGLGIAEVEQPENRSVKLYVRIGIFDNGPFPGDTPRPTHQFTLI